MRALLVVAALSATAAADSKVALTWVVHPANEETLMHQVELEVATGGKSTTIKLKPALGALHPLNQVACETGAYPLEKNEVAKITFYEGGADGYLVRRKGSGFEVVDWFLSDGACEDKKHPGNMVVCPRSEKRVRMLAVPAKSQFTHAIVEVDAAGKRTPFKCDE